MRMSLHRTGAFFVNDKADDTAQCGFRRGDREVFFEVRIDSDSAFLDASGFIMDNNAVQHYFDKKYAEVKVFVSCEEIACAAISDLRRIAGAERVYCIACTIKPGTYAGIHAEQVFACPLDRT